MKILIVDDEPLAISSLRRMIEPLDDVSVAGSARSARSALHMCEMHRPDLILLDVEMPMVDGVTFARDLPRVGAPLVIFVTAYDQFAVDAFDVEAVDYILKPVDPDRLFEAIGKARSRLAMRPLQQAVEAAALKLRSAGTEDPVKGEQPVYWANVGGRSIRLSLNEIRHVEACRDYAYIFTSRDKYMVRETMAALESAFVGSQLTRIHRSHIVNIDCVQSVTRDSGSRLVTLDNGKEVPVGRSYYGRLIEAVDMPAG